MKELPQESCCVIRASPGWDEEKTLRYLEGEASRDGYYEFNENRKGVDRGKVRKGTHLFFVANGMVLGWSTAKERRDIVNANHSIFCRVPMEKFQRCMTTMESELRNQKRGAGRGIYYPKGIEITRYERLLKGLPAVRGGYFEGNPRQVVMTSYERDPSLKSAVIAEQGKKCRVCRFDFDQKYGSYSDGYIEIHHTVPVSKSGGAKTDPNKVIVICSNCHRIIHRGKKMLDWRKLHDYLNRNSKN